MSKWFSVEVEELTEELAALSWPPVRRKYSAEIGDFSPLIAPPFSRLKYKHHIVAVSQELVAHKLCRRMPLAKICELVSEHRVVRTQQYHRNQRDFTNRILKVECNRDETIQEVLSRGTLSCMTCDNLLWDYGGETDDWDEHYRRRDVFEKTCASQRGYARLMLGDDWHGIAAPVFCQECFDVVRKKVRHTPTSWSYNEIRTLKGLAGLVSHASIKRKRKRTTT